MSLIERYNSLCIDIKALEAQKRELRKEILDQMRQNDQARAESGNVIVTKSDRTKVTYDMEQLEFYLLSSGFTSDEVMKSEVDIKKLEKLVADGRLSVNDVIKYADVREFSVLTVKELEP
tara:strand:- start:343 stop:702 length:360 start_codon:yes stop_codon:yes gene_type:complete